MTQSKCWELIPCVDDSLDEEKAIKITKSENSVGRDKNSDILIDDKRCSRKQAIISLSDDETTLTVTPVGTNPCFLCKPGKDKPIGLTKGKKSPIQDGETIRFLAMEFPFLVRYGKEEEKEEKVEEEEGDNMDEDIISEEEEDDRPPCNHGAKCYRKNPDHNKRFYHPHKDMYGNPISAKKDKKKDKKKDVDKDVEMEDISKNDSTKEEIKEKALVSSIPSAGTKIIEEDIEEQIENKKVQINNEIAQKQADTFKKTVEPRKITRKPPPEINSSTKEQSITKPDPYENEELVFSLLLPALCIDSSSKFDEHQSSKIVAKEIIKFLCAYSDKSIRIVFLDSSENHTNLVNKYLNTLFEKNDLPMDSRFTITNETDLSKIVNEYRFVVCPVTWRFKSNHPLTKEILSNKTISNAFKQAKEEHNTIQCGKSCSTQLKEQQGNTQVILFINGPNVGNPSKPNYLNEDYSKATKLLQECYSNVLNLFGELCGFEGITIVSK